MLIGSSWGRFQHEQDHMRNSPWQQSLLIIVQMIIGDEMKTQGIPRFLGEIMATIMTNIGPKGVSFARYSIEYHVLRNYLHCVDAWGEEAANRMLPNYSADIVNHYLKTYIVFHRMVKQVKQKREITWHPLWSPVVLCCVIKSPVHSSDQQ